MNIDRMSVDVSLVCMSVGLKLKRRLMMMSWLTISILVSFNDFHVAMSQNTNFDFHNFENTDRLILLDDAMLYSDSIFLNAIGTTTGLTTCGKMMFQDRVRLLDIANNSSQDTLSVASFTTAFTFSMAGLNTLTKPAVCTSGGGDGLAFLFSVENSTEGDAGGNLCIIQNQDDGKSKNHIFAVELDTYQNEELRFNDPSNNHIGVNINSIQSIATYNLCNGSQNHFNCTYLVNGGDFTVWIDYFGDNHTLEVRLANGSMTKGVKKLPSPLLSVNLDLSKVLVEYMYVGFCGSVAKCNQVNRLKSWSFLSSGMPMAPASAPGPSIAGPGDAKSRAKCNHQVAVLSGISAASGSILVAALILAIGWCFVGGKIRRRRRRGEAAFEQTLFWPRKFTYKELAIATKSFSKEQLLGSGGFGEVYKGTLYDESHLVAVKKMKRDSKQGEREFSAEISVISQIRHRNLVQLIGWCRENNQLLLVYEFMLNSSLDVWLFDSKKASKLTWNLRYNILRGLAAALAYLHEEWEQCIVHRDIKASNVMLDGEFNAHLGDFGLARLIDHDSMPKSTAVAGTLGYLAPELPHTRKATKQSDVYSYGVLALEIACGRPVYNSRASAEEKYILDTVWEAFETEDLLSVADARLLNFFDAFDMNLVLSLGLLCCHPEPDARPTMRLVHQCIIGKQWRRLFRRRDLEWRATLSRVVLSGNLVPGDKNVLAMAQ